MTDKMRIFDTGATRGGEEGKLDFEGFLSPLVLKRYAEYLHKHRTQSDGKQRTSDNWKKGIPLSVYMKSKWRHFMSTWLMLSGYFEKSSLEESLCAELFNTMGMLHEVLLASRRTSRSQKDGCVNTDSAGFSDLKGTTDVSPE